MNKPGTQLHGLFLIALFLLALPLKAAEDPKPSVGPPPPESQASGLLESIQATESALFTELEKLRELEKALADTEKEGNISQEISNLKLMLSAQANRLLQADPEAEALQKDLAEQKATLDAIAGHLKTLREKQEQTQKQLRHTQEQCEINEQQIRDISDIVIQLPPPAFPNAFSVQLLDYLKALHQVLVEKEVLLETLLDLYSTQIEQLESLQTEFTELSAKFEQAIENQQKDRLFERKGLFHLLEPEPPESDAPRLAERFTRIFTAAFWVREFRAISQSGMGFYLSALGLYGLVFFLLSRFRLYCLKVQEQYALADRYPWRCFVFQLFHRSLLLAGTAFFIYAFANLQGIYTTVPVLRTLFYMILVWLVSGWGLLFLALWKSHDKRPIPNPLLFRLRALILLCRGFGLIYLFLNWLLGGDNLIVLGVRLLFETALLIWTPLFWRKFREFPLYAHMGKNNWLFVLRSAIIALGYLIGSGGLFLDFIGYGSMARYWLVSWGWTAAFLLWEVLLFFVLWEWEQGFKQSKSTRPDGLTKPADPLRWLLLRLSWVVWGALAVIALIFAWGAKRAVLVSLWKLLNSRFQLGGITLSATGFLYAFLALIFTHAAVSFWNETLSRKILDDSGLESGLRNSIRAITGYITWILGILIALYLVGIHTTSLAVAFGALGIGLGFGLQNIFNNFISGIILLFERPIQVGDAVELNGIWGEVKRINVRSTVVQTYDNASLIIPNSQFISSQVTNWSFKDLRLRRNIDVGVAYGSDIALVRDTLLEIADSLPLVLKYPHPSVLFTDFGDSALMFRLRIWTDVDNCLNVETDIRFEIDRLFRERRIQIPFPQRDVHLYGTPPAKRFVPLEPKTDPVPDHQADGEFAPEEESDSSPEDLP